MSKKANIKLDSDSLAELMELTCEATGKKAVEKAMLYYIQHARQKDILNFLKSPRFKKNFNPSVSRQKER